MSAFDMFSEFANERPPFKDDDEVSVHTNYSDYDPTKHNPVFFQNGQMHSRVPVDGLELEDFDASKFHPSIVWSCLSTETSSITTRDTTSTTKS